MRNLHRTALDWSKAPLAIAGDFLQAKRLASGLRQTDLAALVPTSRTTVAWLEQGREFSISDNLFRSFCKALECNSLETAFLLRLRGHETNYPTPTTSGRIWQRFVEPFLGPPMLVTNQCWDVLVRSDPANNDFLRLARNRSSFHLLEQYLALADHTSSTTFLHRQIDQFRIDSISHLGQTVHKEIVERLARKSDLFAKRWRSLEFSADSEEPPILLVENNRIKVERMYDLQRGFVLHIFSVDKTEHFGH
jgi:transcriptional regulator with XRE-family HTH domain